MEQAGVHGVRGGGSAGARPHVHVPAVQAGVLCVPGDGHAGAHRAGGHPGRLQVLVVQAGVRGGGCAGASCALEGVDWAGVRAGGIVDFSRCVDVWAGLMMRGRSSLYSWKIFLVWAD